MKKKWRCSLLIAVIIGSVSCKKYAASPVPPLRSILELMEEQDDLGLYHKAFVKAGLGADVFADGGPYTVFAPRDSAMTAAGWTAEKIEAFNAVTLKKLVTTTILKGKLSSKDILGFQAIEIPSLNPSFRPLFNKNYHGLFYNGSKILNELMAGDGVLNKIDKGLISHTESLYDYIMTKPNLTIFKEFMLRNQIAGLFAGGTYILLQNVLKKPADSLLAGKTMFSTWIVPEDRVLLAQGITLEKIRQADFSSYSDPVFSVLQDAYGYSNSNSIGAYFKNDFISNGYADATGRNITGTQNSALLPDGTRITYQITLGHFIETDIMTNNGVLHIIDTVVRKNYGPFVR